ncbi:hypothetical protein [Aeromonas hydrophila]|uniref:hypothetical protein n=1 Tax=Aeromonas hydrophila TaxID=644 RepID=UPI001364E1EB|nr:hypothetical protein [Aeromonas hydrophila]
MKKTTNNRTIFLGVLAMFLFLLLGVGGYKINATHNNKLECTGNLEMHNLNIKSEVIKLQFYLKLGGEPSFISVNGEVNNNKKYTISRRVPIHYEIDKERNTYILSPYGIEIGMTDNAPRDLKLPPIISDKHSHFVMKVIKNTHASIFDANNNAILFCSAD